MAGSEFGGGACVIVPNGNGFYLHPVDNQLSGRVRATRARTGYGQPHRENLVLGTPLFLISEFQVQGMSRETPESKLFNRPESSSFPRKSCLHFMIHVWSMMCPPPPLMSSFNLDRSPDLVSLKYTEPPLQPTGLAT